MKLLSLQFFFVAACVAAPGLAHAASQDDPEPVAQPETASTQATEPGFVEQQGVTYNALGVRARLVVIPQFMLGLFGAEGGEGVVAPSIGPEYVTRRNGVEYSAWLVFASYSLDDSAFKAPSDPDVAYEIVSADLKTLTAGADFLWTADLNERFSFVYGGGVGLGVVFGSLRRNQAYPPSGAPGDPEGYQKCAGPGAPDPQYCGTDNDHYGSYEEPSWFNGGSKPVLMPWIAVPQVGLRFKASPTFTLRLDTGLSFPGPFFFGISGQYGLM